MASGGAKWMLIVDSSSGVMPDRSTVMSTAGLWYLSRTSSERQNFLHKSVLVGREGVPFVVPGPHVTSFHSGWKSHVYPLNFLWENESARTETNTQQRLVQLSHARG